MAAHDQQITALREAVEALYEALRRSRAMPPQPFTSRPAEPEEFEPDSTEEALAQARKALDRVAA